MKGHLNFMGELLLGHLRYGTQGKNNVEFCHPFIKRDIIPARNLALAGNFNLVNTEELFKMVDVNPGDFQKQSDLAAMMEVVHHFIVKDDAANPGNMSIPSILKNAFQHFDGGYNVCGLIGNGDSFVIRDAHGIRPSYYYANNEVIVAASERAAIRTSFHVGENEVKELMPGQALIVKSDGTWTVEQILEPQARRACSFERIYFSRGGDEKIYRERIGLGYRLSSNVLKAINNDLKHTIFSFIPNTAEVAFYGLLKGMEDFLNQIKVQRIMAWDKDFDEEKLSEMINRKIRVEKVAIKDVKMRTFITEDANRSEMVQHVYDVTYGTVQANVDTLVVIDDSIVRGTTLKESIVRMLSRLKPVKIIVLSSAPQIRYPDCYGIDMSKLGDFIAFKAALSLLKDRGQFGLLDELYNKCKDLREKGQLHTENVVKQIYGSFTPQEISAKIAQLITPEEVAVPVEVIYQTIEDLHDACPGNLGDWYFTGNYPTPGGNRVVNMAFINFMEGKDVRGY
jgi:amidophosphoribosyltransferase